MQPTLLPVQISVVDSLKELVPDVKPCNQLNLAGSSEYLNLSVLRSTPGIPPSLCTVLSQLDHDGDGFLSVDAIRARLDGTIIINELGDEKMRKQMRGHDLDGDDSLKLQDMFSAFQISNDKRNKLKFSIAAFVLALLVSCIILAGLVVYGIQITKDSRIGESGIMFVKGTNQTGQVGSADFTVEDGIFHTRTSGTCSAGTCQSAEPIHTLQALQPLRLSSTLDDSTLEQLKQLKLTSGASFISFFVLAIARYAEPGSRHGSLVVVYTHAGELTLDGEAVSFHETLAGAFSRAGFRVDSAGRRLLGVIEVLGLFNAITRAAREAAAGDPAAGSEAPAALPSEFAARVVLSEACEDGAGRSTGACELGDGRRADWAEQDAEGGTALRWEEEQYSLTLGGRRYARETATSAQWPGQSVTALYNETHELVFQTYRGARYHCALRNGSALRAPPPTDSDDGPGPRAELLGFAEVAGVHCRHFRLTVPAGDGPPQAVDLYEDHARRLLRAVRLGGLRWLFANLTAVAGEDQNPLAPADLDLEAVLRDCDPPGIVPPPRIVRGLLTPRLDEDPSWGRPAPQPPPPNASNATLPPAPAPLASSGPGDSEGLRALSAAGAGVGGGGANESSSSAGGDSDGPGPRGCRSRSTNLRGFSASYQECSTSTEITMAGAKPWPACPAISGSLWGKVDWQAPSAYFSGSVTLQFRLDCGALSRLPSAVSGLIPTAALTLSAGFDRLPAASGCRGGFSRGVHYMSGEASVSAGNRWLGISARVQGRLLVGLVCADNQRQGGTVLAGATLAVTGTLYVAGVSAQRAFYVEPASGGGGCGAWQSGSILPDGAAFSAADGFTYNMFDTGIGKCY